MPGSKPQPEPRSALPGRITRGSAAPTRTPTNSFASTCQRGRATENLAQKRCDAIAHMLNSRPGKRYDYATPEQKIRASSGLSRLVVEFTPLQGPGRSEE